MIMKVTMARNTNTLFALMLIKVRTTITAVVRMKDRLVVAFGTGN